MGLTEWLKKKHEENEKRKFRIKAIEKKTETAYWKSREAGTIARKKKEGYAAGMGVGGGRALDTLAKIGSVGKGISESPLFENSFELTGERRHSSRSTKHKKSRAHRKRDKSESGPPYFI